MNSGSYVDPKFPSSEDYGQAGYLPHGDYYNQHIQAGIQVHVILSRILEYLYQSWAHAKIVN